MDLKSFVVNAFGGRVAVIDAAIDAVKPVHDFPAHHIRGLALGSGGTALVIPHQILNRLARTTGDDVYRGLLSMQIVIRGRDRRERPLLAAAGLSPQCRPAVIWRFGLWRLTPVVPAS